VPHRPQLPENLLLCELSTGCGFLEGTSTCYSVGFSMGCGMDLCSGMVLRGLQADVPPRSSVGCKGNLRRHLEHLLPVLLL